MGHIAFVDVGVVFGIDTLVIMWTFVGSVGLDRIRGVTSHRHPTRPAGLILPACTSLGVPCLGCAQPGRAFELNVVDITTDSMRAEVATYADGHEAASIRRCWFTWNVLYTFVYTGDLLAANPMQLVGRPKLAKTLPKALPRTAVEALLETVAQDRDSKRQTDWTERDLAIILAALLAGLRTEGLRQANVGDIRTTDGGAAVIHVKGKGGKGRSVPIEAELLSVIQIYLDSRTFRFPDTEKRQATTGFGLTR